MTAILDANADDIALLDLYWSLPFRDQQLVLQDLVIRLIQHIRETRPSAYGDDISSDAVGIAYALAHKSMPELRVGWPDFMLNRLNSLIQQELTGPSALEAALMPSEGGGPQIIKLVDTINRLISRTQTQEEHNFAKWREDFCNDDYPDEAPSVSPPDIKKWTEKWRGDFVYNLLRLKERGCLQ